MSDEGRIQVRFDSDGMWILTPRGPRLLAPRKGWRGLLHRLGGRLQRLAQW